MARAMQLETVTVLMLAAYIVISAVLLKKVWRRDIYFAVFFSMIVLYSVISQFGYFLVPELSIVMLRMYFGADVLPKAIAFTGLSLIALYFGFRTIYQYTERLSIPVRPGPRSLALYKIICAANILLLCVGLIYFFSDLSYTNASDVTFIEVAGLPYKLFWNLFKFNTFSILILYGLVRFGAPRRAYELLTLRAMWVALSVIFIIIASATGNRTDLLAVVMGCLAIEYFARRDKLVATTGLSVASEGSSKMRMRRRLKRHRIRNVATVIAVLLITVVALTLIEFTRGGKISDDSLEVSQLTQAFLLKDYYTPYHVLLGVMEYDYVSPLAVLTSNASNALMGLKVDFLQTIAVDLWAPGTTTRAASPALFAFTEGYMFMGWAGFIYNGLVFSVGLTLWRLLSRTSSKEFNAVAAGVTLALAATVARSQSSYFVKDIYLYIAPSLALYSLACGCYPRFLSIRRLPRRPAVRVADEVKV